MSHRSTVFQLVILGLVAFAGPGLFNSLNDIPGSVDLVVLDTSKALLYGTFGISAPLAAPVFNMLGSRVVLFFGLCGYIFYAVGQYLAYSESVLAWISLVTAVVLGIGAGLLWCAAGAIIISYPTALERGRFIGYFWALFCVSSIISGFVVFGKEVSGHYFIIVTCMAIGAFIVLLCHENPNRVVRTTKEPVVLPGSVQTSWKGELLGLKEALLDRKCLLLWPWFFYSNFFYTYQLSGLNSCLFSRRSRGLNAGLFWLMQILAGIAIGHTLDVKRLNTRQRGFVGLAVVVVVTLTAYLLALSEFLTTSWGSTASASMACDAITLDAGKKEDSDKAALPMIALVVSGASDSVVQLYAYWLIASFTKCEPHISARYAGIYKGVQSFGAMVAWILDACHVTYVRQTWASLVLFLISVPPALYVAHLVPTYYMPHPLGMHSEAPFEVAKPSMSSVAASKERKQDAAPFDKLEAGTASKAPNASDSSRSKGGGGEQKKPQDIEATTASSGEEMKDRKTEESSGASPPLDASSSPAPPPIRKKQRQLLIPDHVLKERQRENIRLGQT